MSTLAIEAGSRRCAKAARSSRVSVSASLTAAARRRCARRRARSSRARAEGRERGAAQVQVHRQAKGRAAANGRSRSRSPGTEARGFWRPCSVPAASATAASSPLASSSSTRRRRRAPRTLGRGVHSGRARRAAPGAVVASRARGRRRLRTRRRPVQRAERVARAPQETGEGRAASSRASASARAPAPRPARPPGDRGAGPCPSPPACAAVMPAPGRRAPAKRPRPTPGASECRAGRCPRRPRAAARGRARSASAWSWSPPTRRSSEPANSAHAVDRARRWCIRRAPAPRPGVDPRRLVLRERVARGSAPRPLGRITWPLASLNSSPSRNSRRASIRAGSGWSWIRYMQGQCFFSRASAAATLAAIMNSSISRWRVEPFARLDLRDLARPRRCGRGARRCRARACRAGLAGLQQRAEGAVERLDHQVDAAARWCRRGGRPARACACS